MKNSPKHRPRLLVLTQVYRPEPNFITADVAEALAQKMRVTVITAHPNYPYGKFYPGTRFWRPVRSQENGVTVWRLPFLRDQSLSRVRRALAYLSFAFVAAVFAPLVMIRPDVVWVYHGPFTTGLAALWFKFVCRSRVVFTCADLWPECFAASGIEQNGLVMRLLFAYRRAINRVADLLICSTRGMLGRYNQEGIPLDQLRFVPVWVEGIGSLGLQEWEEPSGTPHIVYAGNLGPSQQIDTLIHAAAALERGGVPIIVDIYGTGSSKTELQALARELGVSNVRFHGRVSPEEAFTVSSRAFAQFVALNPSPFFRMTIPSKLSLCFAASAPVIYGLEGEAGALVAESSGGIPFESGNSDSLVNAVRELIARSPAERASMRRKLRRFYDSHFAPSALLREYKALLAPAGEREAVSAEHRGGDPRDRDLRRVDPDSGHGSGAAGHATTRAEWRAAGRSNETDAP